MRIYTTKIRAIDPVTGDLKLWAGQDIHAESFEKAEQYCREKIGYCEVDGELISVIDEHTGIKIDFDNLN